MKVGDLVRYHVPEEQREWELNEKEQLGIITGLGTHLQHWMQCHIVWYTCDNEGWWNRDKLEVVSEGR